MKFKIKAKTLTTVSANNSNNNNCTATENMRKITLRYVAVHCMSVFVVQLISFIVVFFLLQILFLLFCFKMLSVGLATPLVICYFALFCHFHIWISALNLCTTHKHVWFTIRSYGTHISTVQKAKGSKQQAIYNTIFANEIPKQRVRNDKSHILNNHDMMTKKNIFFKHFFASVINKFIL